MNGSHLALKDELVVGIDDDGLEVRVCWHQAKIALVTGGGVDGLHRQPAVDEGHDDVAVRNLLRTIHQADVAVEYPQANHRLSLDADKIRCLCVMHKLFVQIEILMLIVTCWRRESRCQSFKVRQFHALRIFQCDVLGAIDGFLIIHNLLYFAAKIGIIPENKQGKTKKNPFATKGQKDKRTKGQMTNCIFKNDTATKTRTQLYNNIIIYILIYI